MASRYKIVKCGCGMEFMTQEDDLEKCPACEKKRKEEKTFCKHCKNEFVVVHGGQMYCCKKCSIEGQKVANTCNTCGKTFKGFAGGKYCSKKCRPVYHYESFIATCTKCSKKVKREKPIKVMDRWLCAECRRANWDIRRTSGHKKTLMMQEKILKVLTEVYQNAIKNHEHVPWLIAKEINKRAGILNTNRVKYEQAAGTVLGGLTRDGIILRKRLEPSECYKMRVFYRYQLKGETNEKNT